MNGHHPALYNDKLSRNYPINFIVSASHLPKPWWRWSKFPVSALAYEVGREGTQWTSRGVHKSTQTPSL